MGSAVDVEGQERRLSARDEVSGKVKYRLEGADEYSEAEVVNISSTGLFIRPAAECGTQGTRIEILVEPEEAGPKPITLVVSVVRVVEEDSGKTGLGCVVEQMKNVLD